MERDRGRGVMGDRIPVMGTREEEGSQGRRRRGQGDKGKGKDEGQGEGGSDGGPDSSDGDTGRRGESWGQGEWER